MQLRPVMTANEVSAFWDRHFPQVKAGGDLDIVSVEGGQAVLRLTPNDRHLRPGGTVSGPALFTLADVGAYAVLLAHVGPEPLIVTANLCINFMRRAPVAPLLGRCRILKLGRRLAVVEIAIQAEADCNLVAQATGTYSLPPPKVG